jgi:hypothetical protein
MYHYEEPAIIPKPIIFKLPNYVQVVKPEKKQTKIYKVKQKNVSIGTESKTETDRGV